MMRSQTYSQQTVTNLGLIAGLRDRLGRLGTSGRVLAGRVFPFGTATLDAALPWGGLPAGSLHEVVGQAPLATAGFLAAYLGSVRRGRPVLWLTPERQLHAPALAAFGFDHRRLTIAWTRRPEDRLQAFEEALRTPGIAAVVAEIDGLDLAATRRLQQAAQAGGALGLLIRRDAAATVALTRWCIAPAQSDGRNPRWQVRLERDGFAAQYAMEWGEARGFRVL
ncbi:ImuA family protein [Ferrovibrio xuzhouensis]|uniref:ImuA family protein n=1 Tax=Ferrovibrio xuzhouensis TaxID=1576914 RepID=A0ABV7VLN3_9PROT